MKQGNEGNEFAYLEVIRKNAGVFVDELVSQENISALCALCKICYDTACKGSNFQCTTCSLRPHIDAIIDRLAVGDDRETEFHNFVEAIK